jgi:SAM-dependent methyltransferase
MTPSAKFDGRSYQARIDAIAKQGIDMHGEATLIRSFHPRSVLDAGCGTGRVAIELARHDIEVVGVDVDASMIAEAKRLAPELDWIHADLTTLILDQAFDVVVLAGNIPLFCATSSRGALIQSCANHVGSGGSMIVGFQLRRGYEIDEFDRSWARTGLELIDRWATWDGQPFLETSEYVVSVLTRSRNDQP